MQELFQDEWKTNNKVVQQPLSCLTHNEFVLLFTSARCDATLLKENYLYSEFML